MKKWLITSCVVIIAACFGCSFQTPVSPVYDVNIYSTSSAKIPGRYALIVKDNPNMLDIDVHPSSAVGADATFNVAFASSFKDSVIILNKEIFAEIIESDTVPSLAQMKSDNLSGYIQIASKFFEVDTKSVSGMFSTGVKATANLGFDYIIKNSNGETLLTGVVSSSRATSSQGGVMGTTASDNTKAIQSAIQNALRDDLEQYAQKVTNDPKLREAVLPPISQKSRAK